MADQVRWQQLEAILSSLDGLSEAERGPYLDRACAGDAELRAEAESLLSYDSSASADLQSIVTDAAVAAVAEPSFVGRRLGPYSVISQIGSGGMGVVYLASRADGQFQKQVAIKLVKRGMDTAAVVERFRHERQILASLDHPYIGKLLDAGATEDGRPYFVMEYIAGRPIDEYCGSLDLSVEQRCQLFRKVCEAVSYAHRNLVIHRDLKPSNILVTEDGQPKLLDFGIAKILRPQGDGRSIALTMLHAPVLTPDYASPEQVRGGRVTTATDVYALGAVLYRLLTGQKPHRLSGYTAAEMDAAICVREPPRPSVAAPRKIGRRLQGDLDNIVLMAMRKEQWRRYQFVDNLSEDLRRHLEGLPVSAHEDATLYRARKFLRRHRLGVAAAALVAVSLAAGAIVSIFEARRAVREQRLAEERLGQIAELANTSLFDIHDAIEGLPGAIDARKKIVATALTFLDRLAKTSGNDPKVVALLSAAYMRLGDVQGLPNKPNLGDTEGARAGYLKALALLEANPALRPGDAKRLMGESDLHGRLGRVALKLGHLSEALDQNRLSLAAAERLAAVEPSPGALNRVAGGNLLLADLLGRTNSGEGLPYAQKAVVIDEQLVKSEPGNADALQTLSDAYSSVARSFYYTSQRREAVSWIVKTIAIREQMANLKPNDLTVQRDLLLAYEHAGDLMGAPWAASQIDAPGARAYYQKSVNIAEALVRADPKNGTARSDLVGTLYRRGGVMPDPRDAPKDALASLAMLHRSATLAEDLQAQDPNNLVTAADRALTYEFTGTRLAGLGARQEAMSNYRKSLEIALHILAVSPQNMSAKAQVLTDYRGIASLQAVTGEREAAIALCRKVFETVDGYLANGADTPAMRTYVPRSRQWLASVYENLAEWRAAHAAYADSLALWKKLGTAAEASLNEQEIAAVQAGLARCERRIK